MHGRIVERRANNHKLMVQFFRETQKLPDASHNVKQATELEDKVLGAIKFKVKADGAAEADVKEVANDERSSHAMAKDEPIAICHIGFITAERYWQ